VNSEQFSVWCQSNRSILKSTDDLRKPLIMGVLNVTPDSFSDGGQHPDPEAAFQRAMIMIEQGADIIDIGGESARPGAVSVSVDIELNRVIPVIERIRSLSDVCISIDTCKAEVMSAAVTAGASIVNDIAALRGEGVLPVVARMDVPVCLMHMQGSPVMMQDKPCYSQDIDVEINDFFKQRIAACEQAGIRRDRLILDPGFGFGKSVQHNLMLLKRMAGFQQHGLPVLLGVSRKSTLGAISGKKVMERMPAGLAIAVFAILNGVSIVRTHDVAETTQALQMIDAIRRMSE
jgi:dihydropteroate synthase